MWLTAVWWVSGASLSAVGCDKKRLLVLQQPVVRRVSCRAAHGCSAATGGNQRALLEGGAVGRPARSTRALVSCGRPRSRRRAASNPVRCAHGLARRLAVFLGFPDHQGGGGTGAPWGLISPADAPFPVPVVLVFVVAVFGLALVGYGGKARLWSYCWSSPCSSRLGQR